MTKDYLKNKTIKLTLQNQSLENIVQNVPGFTA